MKLKDKILKAGIDNCLFILEMKPVYKVLKFPYSAAEFKRKPKEVPAVISEKEYKISGNYKITLKSIDEDFGDKTFYLDDLEILIKNGDVKFYIKQN